jgi:large subunit ribosomal protein L6e
LQAPVIAEQKKKDQKTVDDALLKVIAKEAFLKVYLNAKFSLTKNDRVHELKF